MFHIRTFEANSLETFSEGIILDISLEVSLTEKETDFEWRFLLQINDSITSGISRFFLAFFHT